MQPFGAAFRGLNRKSLQAVAQEIVAFVLGPFRSRADAFARGHHKKRQVVALATLSGQDVIAEAKKVSLALPGELERMQRLFRPWRKEMQAFAFRFRLEELPDCADLHERSGFLL